MSIPGHTRDGGGLPVLRLGLLGAGYVNERIVVAARDVPAVTVAALASRDHAKASNAAQYFGIPRAFGSYEKLLAQPDIDAVYIGLPNSLHLPWAEEALRHGKHVLVEKPLSRDHSRVAELVELAQVSRLLVVEGFMFRYHPQTARILDIIIGRELGAQRLLQMHFSFPLAKGSNVRWSPELEGGALMDLGCYCLAASRLFAGPPEEITARAVIGPSGVDTKVAATLVTAQDIVTRFDVDFALPRYQQMTIHFEAGRIEISSPFHCRGGTLVITDHDGRQTVENFDSGNAFAYELQAFADAIHGVDQHQIASFDAVVQASCLDMLYHEAGLHLA
ncbi:MAG: hypothetical protein DLM58_18360 [Pseudonocardiales bacterium]|nr:MAG: hypothetical protein DLM58_18360 [Pseudonocardiales bacterium]